MLKAVIFDLDGTLLDTSRDINRILNQSLAKFGLPPVTLKETLAMVGDGAYKLIERAVQVKDDKLVRAVYDYYVPVFAACDNSLTTLYEGEADVLEKLKAAGIKIAVLTNKPQAAADEVCRAKLSQFGFDMIVGQTERFDLKPNPAAALYIAHALGARPQECVFVGDGETDYLTAKNAGMPCISALWGFRTREALEKAGANTFAENFSCFLKILQKNFLFNT